LRQVVVCLLPEERRDAETGGIQGVSKRYEKKVAYGSVGEAYMKIWQEERHAYGIYRPFIPVYRYMGGQRVEKDM